MKLYYGFLATVYGLLSYIIYPVGALSTPLSQLTLLMVIRVGIGAIFALMFIGAAWKTITEENEEY